MRRLHTNPQQRESFVRQFEQSKLTQEEFARENNLNVGSFPKWIYDYRKQRNFCFFEVHFKKIQQTELLNGDETRVQVQQTEKTRTAWMWTFLSATMIGFVFSSSRSEVFVAKNQSFLYSICNSLQFPERPFFVNSYHKQLLNF